MATNLPHGLMSNTEEVSSELKGAHSIELEDIAKLWRVYTTNKVTLKQGAGRRLENLFWRIWSNGRISSKITGSTLAKLFIQMTDETPLWTQNREELNSLVKPPIPKPREPIAIPAPPVALAKGKESAAAQTSAEEAESSSRANVPPSILKKPSQPASQNIRKSARFVFENLDTKEGRDDFFKRFRPPPGWYGVKDGFDLDDPRQRAAMLAAYIDETTRDPPGPSNNVNQRIFDPKYACRSSGAQKPTHNLDPEDLSPKTAVAPKPEQLPPIQPGVHPQRVFFGLPHYNTEKAQNRRALSEQKTTSTATQQQSRPHPRPIAPKSVEPLATMPLVEKDFRTRFVERKSRESRISSLTSLISSEESLSLSLSPVAVDPERFNKAVQNAKRRGTSSQELLPTQAPEPTRTLLSSSPLNPSRGESSRLVTRQTQESQLSRLIEEGKRSEDG